MVFDTVKNPSFRVMKILNGGKEEIMAALLQDKRVTTGIMTDDLAPETLTEVLLPQIVRERYPDLNEDEVTQVCSGFSQALVVTELGGVINGEDLPDNAIIDGVQEEGADYKTGKQFVKMGEKFINIENLNVDLIRSVNPFQHAYEI